MRHILIIVLLSLVKTNSSAQSPLHKKVIDTSVLPMDMKYRKDNSWPIAQYGKVSPYGHYIAYCVRDPLSNTYQLTIESNDGKWKRSYRNSSRPQFFFSADERFAITVAKDTVFIVSLNNKHVERSIVVNGSALLPYYTSYLNWLAYQEKGPNGHEKLLDFSSGQEVDMGPEITSIRYDNDFDPSQLFYQRIENGIPAIYCYDLSSKQEEKVWAGQAGDKVIIQPQNEVAVLQVSRKENNVEKQTLWFWHKGERDARVLIADGDGRLPTGCTMNGQVVLSGNHRWVFFTLQKPPQQKQAKPNLKLSKVNVWSYKDAVIQPGQAKSIAFLESEPITCSIGIDGKNFQMLTRTNDELANNPKEIYGDYAVLCFPDSSATWVPNNGAFAYPKNCYLVSLHDGRRKLLQKNGNELLNHFNFSPDGQWLVWWDINEELWKSYEIASGKIYQFTQKVNDRFDLDKAGYPKAFPVGFAGWCGRNALVYSRYDLWLLDPSGKLPAENLTRGYGLAHHIRLRLCDKKKEYHDGDTLFFTGFKDENKYNGFFREVLGMNHSFQKLTFGPYQYFWSPSQGLRREGNNFDDGMSPVKAAFADAWIVERESAIEYPNLYFTKDFKEFRNLTNLSPQKDYNWLTSELIHFKQLDGTIGEAILYKPEDFDPKRKYPVIINFYENLTHRLYQFPQPEYDGANINIPWFVSRGYLVVTPSIHYKNGAESNKTYGEWALNTVAGAANYLASLPFVNGKCIGIQGMSFGGGEASYIAVHSHLFAAAEEFSGMNDAIIEYLCLLPYDNADHDIQGFGQYVWGATLWQRPDLYLKSVNVLYADRMTTPLLMVHDKADGAVPYQGGIELYLALRRLQKPGWLLTYDDGNHALDERIDAIDHTYRITEFFNHYLKGYPPPIWMTRGIPADKKQIEAGYELDLNGSCSADCPICKKKDYKAWEKEQSGQTGDNTTKTKISN